MNVVDNAPTELRKKLNEIYHALEEVNIDPFKIMKISIFKLMVQSYLSGDWTIEQLQENCLKLNYFNEGDLSLYTIH